MSNLVRRTSNPADVIFTLPFSMCIMAACDGLDQQVIHVYMAKL